MLSIFFLALIFSMLAVLMLKPTIFAFKIFPKAVKARLLVLFLLISIASSCFFVSLFIERARMPYNELGRYFDSDHVVVYFEQAKEIYGIFAFLSLVSSLASLYPIYKTNKK